MEEIFYEENGYLVGNILYEGVSSANNGMNVGYKVLTKNKNFIGLLDQNKIAIWNTIEETLERL